MCGIELETQRQRHRRGRGIERIEMDATTGVPILTGTNPSILEYCVELMPVTIRTEQGDFPHENWRKVPFSMFQGECIMG